MDCATFVHFKYEGIGKVLDKLRILYIYGKNEAKCKAEKSLEEFEDVAPLFSTV